MMRRIMKILILKAPFSVTQKAAANHLQSIVHAGAQKQVGEGGPN